MPLLRLVSEACQLSHDAQTVMAVLKSMCIVVHDEKLFSCKSLDDKLMMLTMKTNTFCGIWSSDSPHLR